MAELPPGLLAARERVAASFPVRWLWLVLPAFTLFHVPSETWFQNTVHVGRLHLDTSEVVLACFALSCLLVASAERLRLIWASGMALPWLVYIAALLLSTAFAADRQLALIEDVQVTAGVLLALTVWLTITSAVQVRTVLTIIAIGGAAVTIALIVIAAYAARTTSHPCPDTGLCLGDSLNIRSLLIAGRLYPRAEIPGVDYNRTGLELVLATLTTVYLSHTASGRHRLAWAGVAMFPLTGVVLTFSKGALVSLAVAGALILVLGWWRSRTLVVAGTLELVVLFASGYLIPLALRVLSIFSFIPFVNQKLVAGGTLDTSDRLAMAHSTLPFIQDRPIIGIGPLNLQGIENVQGLSSAEHNDYIRALAETGIIGLASLLLVMAVPVAMLGVTLAGARHIAERERLTGQLLLAGLGALIVNFLVAPVDYSFWVWTGLIATWLTRCAPDMRLASLPARLHMARGARSSRSTARR